MFEVSVLVNNMVSVNRQIPTEAQLGGYLEQIPDLIAMTKAKTIVITIQTHATGEPTLPDFERHNTSRD